MYLVLVVKYLLLDYLKALLINDLYLLADRLFVDCFKDQLHKVCAHAALFSLRTALFQDFIVASCLKNGDSVFFLVSTDLACYAHSLSQFLDDVVVAFVDLLTQLS